jgi:YVTN family beta-propeller protein
MNRWRSKWVLHEVTSGKWFVLSTDEVPSCPGLTGRVTREYKALPKVRGHAAVCGTGSLRPALQGCQQSQSRCLALAARSNGEVWVVNHLSDSVSVVDVASAPPRVVRTLLTCDEPRDIVFAGSGNDRAFVTTARRGRESIANRLPAPLLVLSESIACRRGAWRPQP